MCRGRRSLWFATMTVMSQRVSRPSYARRVGRYLFLLSEQNQFDTPVRQELRDQMEAFGATLGRQGSVAHAFASHSAGFWTEVMDKPWPDEVERSLSEEFEPVLVVIDRDWDAFSPDAHPFALIWLKDLRVEDVARSLNDLAIRAHNAEDLIAYLKAAADRRIALEAAANGATWLARIAS